MRPREKKRAGEGTRTLDIQLGKLDVKARIASLKEELFRCESYIYDFSISTTSNRAMSRMRLCDLVKRYGDSRDLSTPYLKMLFCCVKTMLPEISTVDEITPDAVNTWLSALPGSTETRRRRRRECLTLWRFAIDESLTDVPCARVKEIKKRAAIVTCWTRSEILFLLREAGEFKSPPHCGRRSKALDDATLLRSWIHLGYETGLRFSDIHSLAKDNFRGDLLVVVCQKTGKTCARRLSSITMAHVEKLLSISLDGSLFSALAPRRSVLVLWQAFLKSLNYPGSSKWLRRSAATHCEASVAGSGGAFLQHNAGSDVTRRHYIDAGQLPLPVGPRPLE
jgi:hypothetical protein